MDEKRKSVRKYLYNYSKVFDEDTRRISGRLVNLTHDGMMLMTDKPVEQETPLRFRMALPEGIGVTEQRSITFDGTCRWCKKAYNPDYYDVGFEFTNVPDNSRGTIEYLMRFHSFNY